MRPLLRDAAKRPLLRMKVPSGASHTVVIARLDPTIQYAAALVIDGKAAAYWITRLRG
jgi:hypothetical protein